MGTAELLLTDAAIALIATAITSKASFRHFRYRLVAAALAAATALVIALAALHIANQAWWGLGFIACMAINIALLWDFHINARLLRMPLLWRWLGRHNANGFPRRMQSLDELRAEYAQTILDDAARDPGLNALLDQLASGLDFESNQPAFLGRLTKLEALTTYANRHVQLLSSPDFRPLPSAYGRYSGDMLVLAAMCRRGEQLQARR